MIKHKPKWSIELEKLRGQIDILKLLRKEDKLIIYNLTVENHQLIEDNKKLREVIKHGSNEFE